MKIKNTAIILFVIILSTQLLMSQNNLDYQIKEFDQISSEIESYDSLNLWSYIKTKDLSGLSTEGSNIKYHIENEVIKKIIFYNYGETGKRISVYYLLLDNPFLINELLFKYNRPIYWDEKYMKENNDNEIFDINKTSKTEVKSYFIDGDLIYQVYKPEKEFNLTEKEIIIEQERLREEFDFLMKHKSDIKE